ncbi:MAG TPA: LamG-like jellyroll fold domain-containing protein, partial [Verrucomicrobiae bacterium]|nr:LamG-like jellyroll fold domain-containing protein [Verrucomicrobiae bacterium]
VGWEPPPYIVQQPVSINVFRGTNATLSAMAAGDANISSPTISYQWAAGPTNGPYTNLTNTAKYAGMTSPTLTISNAADSDENVVYVLKASNSGGMVTSAEAHVYVQAPLVLPAPGSFGAAIMDLASVQSNHVIGFWQLNETNDPSSGLLVAIDASGAGHSGVYGSSAQNAFNGVAGPTNLAGFAPNQGALQTTSGNANSIVNLPALNNTNGVDTTICMWINPSQVVGVNDGLFYNRSSVDQCGIQFGGTTGGPSGQYNLTAFWSDATGYASYTHNTGLYPANNTWNFVVLVVRSNALTYYLDYVDANGAAYLGKDVDAGTPPTRFTQQVWGGTPIWLGGDPNGSEFPGSIANVAFFNSALSDAQVSQLFATAYGVAGFPAAFAQQPPTNTIGYVGYTVQISAQTGGSPTITNQWKFNGTNLVDGSYQGSIISGSTSNVLTIQSVTTNWNGGVFNLAITNALSSVVSSNATLTILYPSAPPAGNLVGEWFNGTDSLIDHSGYTAPGTHDAFGVGPVGTNYRFTNSVPPGKSGDSLNLYGGTSMGIANSSTNDAGYMNTFDEGISNSFTVALWARGQPAAWNPFVSKYGETTPSPQAGWQLRRSAGANAVFTMRGTGTTDDPAGAGGGSGADGAWHHYTGTYDLATGIRTLYVDGIVQDVTPGNGPYILAYGERLVLGGRSTNEVAAIAGTANFTGGMLYDVRIYNVALTASQVAYLAQPPLQPTTITLDASVLPPSGGNPGQLTLTWPYGTLLQATNAAGPWATNNVISPYTILMTNPAEFYKVQVQ